MPYYAMNRKDQIVSAQEADSLDRYQCLECRGPMKKRMGKERRPHFSHLRKAPQCRLYSKSVDHLVLQTELKKKLPQLILERPFISILRIADLCWEEERLVLEIQCSLIDPLEVERRSLDYQREGYSLVWLLDDRLFNKRHLRLAELSLRSQACYFFSLQKTLVYDQFEVLFQSRRLLKGPPLPITLSSPRPLPHPLPSPLTAQLAQRHQRIFFRGDLFQRILDSPLYLERLIEQEEAFLADCRKNRSLFDWLKMGFFIALEFLLRRSTSS